VDFDDRALVDLALRRGLLTPDELREAEEQQGRAGGSLSTVLVARGTLSRSQIEEIRAGEETLLLATAPSGPVETAPPDDVAAAARDPRNDLGKFVLVRVLGQGGMGTVYKAWEKPLRRYVAVKFVDASSAEQGQQLLREAQTAARLEHANIAPVYEIGACPRGSFIVMKYIEGTTLDEAPLDVRGKVQAVRDAALALHHAHAQRIIHRDIKPQNIMVEVAERNRATAAVNVAALRALDVEPKVYIMDFGLARTSNVHGSLTAAGLIAGTPQFMAPEQARGQSDRIDRRTDVYALGATLHAVLGGSPPFTGDDPMQILEKVVNGDPPRLRGVPRDLETIALKCLEKEPGRRYGSARELAQDLDRWLAGEPVQARPASVLYRLRKRIAKHRAAVGAAAAGAALLAIACAFLVTRWLHERALRRDDEVRHTALLELAGHWSRVVLAKQGWYQPQTDPAATRARIAEAVERVAEFARAHPSLPQAWYVCARGRLALWDHRGAEEDARRAIAIDSGFGPAWVLLGRVKVEQYLYLVPPDAADHAEYVRLNQEALGTAVDAMRRGRGTRLSIAEWGLGTLEEEDVAEKIAEAFVAWHVHRDSDGARRLLEEAHGKTPSPDLAHWIGWLEAGPERRLERQREAIRLMPHHFWAHCTAAHVQYELGRRDEALAGFRLAAAIHPGLPIVHFNIGVCLGQAGDSAAAADSFSRAIEVDRTFGLAFLDRGCMRLRLGDPSAALADLDEAVRLRPTEARAYANRAGARLRLGDSERALQDAARAIELRPRYAFAHEQRGRAHLARRDLTGAIDELTKALEIAPQADTYNSRAIARLSLRDWKGVIDDCTEAIRLDPDYVRPYNNRARARFELGDDPRGLEDCDEALRRDPRNGIALEQRAPARVRTGDFRGALADYAAAIGLRGPDDPVHLAHLLKERGTLHHALGEFDAALADFEEALRLAPRYAEALAARGATRLQTGRTQAAIDDLSRALELDPKNPLMHYGLALARERLGDLMPEKRYELWGAAEEGYASAFQLGAGWPQRRLAEQRLRQVRRKLGREE